MSNPNFSIESNTPFVDSKIWQLNRQYYDNEGINAWSSGVVPHHLTSNSKIAKTYANLIFAVLEDLAVAKEVEHTVYILELGAGHGRLSFHILVHLNELISMSELELPKYQFVISDVVEKNLDFFLEHPQFQKYFNNGQLDVSYFDADKSIDLKLRFSGKYVDIQSIDQVIMAIGNYFFDSLPNDLFHIKEKKVHRCELSLRSNREPENMTTRELLKSLKLTYTDILLTNTYFKEEVYNDILEQSRLDYEDTHLFFPKMALDCLMKIKNLSKKGLILLTLDKGSHKIVDLDNQSAPIMTTHGSMSFSVNFHAFILHCQHLKGVSIFPSNASFHLQIGCLMYIDNHDKFSRLVAAYKTNVDDFGPDDFNSIKKLIYRHANAMSMPEIFASLRLAAYDSTLFINLLPSIKSKIDSITIEERERLKELMLRTLEMYYSMNESMDIAFEIGGIFYQLSYYEEALYSFNCSKNIFGDSPDNFYNTILCYYQLRKDMHFKETLERAKYLYPDFESFEDLSNLDLGAE